MTTKELLAKMMSFRPVTAEVERLNALTEFVAAYLYKHGVHTKMHSMDGRKCLYASTTADAEGDEVLFNAHLDVVPAEDEQFEARETDGWIVGRGTHDCLGNCAVLMQVLCRAMTELEPPRVGVIFSTDEEVGGATTGFMAERVPAPKRMILVVDGSGNSVVVAQKGVLTVRLTAKGVGCHSAEPWKGDNAIDRLVDGYARVRRLFPQVEPPNEWESTLAATVIRGGSVHNRVPEVAEITLNIRLVETDDREDVLRRLSEASGLEVAVDMSCDPVFCDPESPELKALVEFMKGSLNREIPIKRSNGATDARHFTRFGVPIAIIGVHGRDLHGADEALELASMREYEEMLLDYLWS
jgi:succinyl-diaminopimelate desuccinylase